MYWNTQKNILLQRMKSKMYVDVKRILKNDNDKKS